ncbi:MAG: hypothetical protein QOD66_3570 [Solirubrobacteraceae bacterium]|jgi:hypothetical protein|nr:hypothetical protein [Solirubrobacteraceae bacterium]
MFAAVTIKRRLARCTRGAGLALLCTAATATAASGASLSVSVPAHSVRQHHTFLIKLSGSYRAAELKGKAYLVAAFQYDTKPCKATGAAEAGRSDASFFFSKVVSPSPFVRRFGFTAGQPGPRRVCAYLYPKVVSPMDTTVPIARATGLFRVVK